MVRILLAASLAVNLALGAALYQYVDSYESLLEFACEHGNGGAECGED